MEHWQQVLYMFSTISKKVLFAGERAWRYSLLCSAQMPSRRQRAKDPTRMIRGATSLPLKNLHQPRERLS
jgi:hypothetical protein